MKYFYRVQTATLQANPPRARFQCTTTPGLPDWSLVVVEEWNDPISQDAWEALPSVAELRIWNWNNTVPAVLVTAFGPWGVVATDTIGDAVLKIRAFWPAARH